MYGVNPRHDGGDIAGWPMCRSLAEIEVPVDLALVAVPAAATLDVVKDCAKAGVRAAVLAAAGMGELDAEGRSLEARSARSPPTRACGCSALTGSACSSPTPDST